VFICSLDMYVQVVVEELYVSLMFKCSESLIV